MKKQTPIITLLTLILSVASLCSCNTLEYHPYDAMISGETALTKKNMKRIEEALSGKDSVRFAVISDTQRWYRNSICGMRMEFW